MKTPRYRIFAFVLLFVFMLGTSLPAAQPVSGSGQRTAGNYQVYLPVVMNTLPPIIPDTTTVLPDTTTDHLTSVSGDGAAFTFDPSTPGLSGLAAGDVMIGEPTNAAPDGFLRKVDSINTVNGQTVVQTEAATLEDAVQQGEAQFSQELTPGQVKSARYTRGVSLSPQSYASQASAFYLKIEDVVLYDDDKDPKTTNDQVRASGSIEVEPSINFDLRLRNWELEKFLATVSLHDKVEIKVESKTTLKKWEPTPFTLATMTLTPFTFWIGWVPVVFTPVLTFEVGIEGELYVTVSTSVTQEATLTGGVKFENNQWTPVHELNNVFNFQPPTMSGGLDIKAYAGPRLKFLLYGVAGPEFKLDGYLKLEVSASLPPNEDIFEGELYGGVGLSVKVKVEILGKKIYDYDFPDLFGWKVSILKWPPDAAAAPSPADAAIDQALNATLSWTATAPPLFPPTYDVYLEAGDDTPDVLVSASQAGTTYTASSLLPGTQYYWQIIAREGIFGLTTDGPVWSFTTRPNHPPAAPSNPAPANGADNRSTNGTLSWTASDPDGDGLTYDVYLGTNAAALGSSRSSNQAGTSYAPALLNTGTPYYWQIVARDPYGATTAGPVWSFTTALRAAWSGSGPGTITVVSDGLTADPVFTYHLQSAGFDPVTWSFTTVADHTGPVVLGYDFSGLHAWFQVTAFLRAVVNGSPVATLVNAGPVDCCTAPSNGFQYTGSYTFDVIAGQTYGFQFGGSNGDYNNTLQGRLEVQLPPWNTLLGSAGSDRISDIAVDPIRGNVYVAGTSDATWGSPIWAYSGSTDAFVAKFDPYGSLLWNTFLGSASADHANGIALDEDGNVYVAGDSRATWGTPIIAYTGGEDGFAAQLNSSGTLQWNFFMGSTADDSARDLASPWPGYVNVIGNSNASWGTPENPYAGGTDVFYAEYSGYDSSLDNTFLGSPGQDEAGGIALGEYVFVTGTSDATWGAPKNPFAGGTDAFVASLADGVYLRDNTFLGSAGADVTGGIATDASATVYVTGTSATTWGTPTRPYSGGTDVFVASLDQDLLLQKNSFLGSAGQDQGGGIAANAQGVYAVGTSAATWGAPTTPFAGGTDAFAAYLAGDLSLTRISFLGSDGQDEAGGIALDDQGVYVAGSSAATWGAPIRPYAGGMDGFVAFRR